MSEHKTNNSNWDAKQKRDYRDRRQEKLRGQRGYAKVVQTLDDGNIVPVSEKLGGSGQRGKRIFRRQEWREHRAADRRNNRRRLRLNRAKTRGS